MDQPRINKHIWWKSELSTDSESGVLCAGYYSGLSDHAAYRTGIPQWVILYCVGGRGTVTCGGSGGLAAEPGTVFCLPALKAHSYRADPAEPWAIYWFHCNSLLEPELMERLPLMVKAGILPDWIQRMEALLAEMNLPASLFRTAKCRTLGQMLLVDILEAKPQDRLMERVKEYIESLCRMESSAAEPTVAQIAARFGLSEYHFIRQFGQYVGMSPGRYRVVLRVRQACGLLQTSGDSIAQISVRLGYQSPYYFSRQFKQITGYSPREYRELSKLL